MQTTYKILVAISLILIATQLSAQTYYLSLFNTQQVYALRPTAFGKASQLAQKPLQGELALLIDSSYTNRELACQALNRDYVGKIALINMGACDFGKKLKKAEQAGAVAIIFLKDAAATAQTKNGKYLAADLDSKAAKVPCFTLEPDSLLLQNGTDQNEVLRVNAPSMAFIYAVASKANGREQVELDDPTLQPEPFSTTATSDFFEGEITLSPNPTLDATQLHLVFSEATDSEVQVFNLMGQLMQRQAVPQAFDTWVTLDLSTLPVGRYQVRVVNGQGSWAKGVIRSLP